MAETPGRRGSAADSLHGQLVSRGRRTVAQYFEQWLAAVKASLEPAGSTNYRTCLTLYVLPRLGHVQLAALTPLTLSSLYADLPEAAGRGTTRCPRRRRRRRCCRIASTVA